MRPPRKRPSGPDSTVCQAMRRSCSNSITVFDTEYGTPIFIDMPKVEPRLNCSAAPSLALTSWPEPSISGWRVASAPTAKRDAAGALMTRSTLTTVCCEPCAMGDLRLDGVRDQVAQLHPLQGGGVRRGQDDGRRHAGLEGLLPARGAQAPLVSGLQAGEAELGMGCGQVVADRRREDQELGGDPGAHRVDAVILGPGVAAAVTVETGER